MRVGSQQSTKFLIDETQNHGTSVACSYMLGLLDLLESLA